MPPRHSKLLEKGRDSGFPGPLTTAVNALGSLVPENQIPRQVLSFYRTAKIEGKSHECIRLSEVVNTNT